MRGKGNHHQAGIGEVKNTATQKKRHTISFSHKIKIIMQNVVRYTCKTQAGRSKRKGGPSPGDPPPTEIWQPTCTGNNKRIKKSLTGQYNKMK